IVHDQRYGQGLPFELILSLALIGGCAYSTSGGLKVFRLGAMLRHSFNEARRAAYPHSTIAHSLGVDSGELAQAKAIWSAFYLSLLVIIAASILFTVQGIPLDRSLGAAVGAFSSTGSLFSSSIGAAPGTLPAADTLMLSALVALFAR